MLVPRVGMLEGRAEIRRSARLPRRMAVEAVGQARVLLPPVLVVQVEVNVPRGQVLVLPLMGAGQEAAGVRLRE